VTRLCSSMPDIAVQTAFAGDALDIRLQPSAARSRYRSIHRLPVTWCKPSGQVINWPDRNGRGKLCRTKVLLLHFVGQHGNNNYYARGHRSQDRDAVRLAVAAGSAGQQCTISLIHQDAVLVRCQTPQFGLLQPISRTSQHDEFRSRRLHENNRTTPHMQTAVHSS